ncbi:GNAT family N-acetyltransferase [Singulisphaera acidiphila]|uniref:GNAT family N-acetyltransferase n=1 Tax=Singulisphaera acidiphila TaxID=466153 RepID=UPI0003739011|nr:GNAT family N-acetyltransferase [Singulisphaera acidiphila]
MIPEIRPLRPDDLQELSRFLIEGFHAPSDAAFAAPDVLGWKSLEPIHDGDEIPRSFIASEEGRIVGHVGLCPTAFEGLSLPPGGITTLHMVDWLGSRVHRALGSALMRHAHQKAKTQYVLVANERARRVTGGAGYTPTAEVTVFQKVLRIGYRWRVPGLGPGARLLRVGRDAARKVLNPGRSPQIAVELRQVREFGPEVGPILDDWQARAILTSRSPERLNHALHYPRPGMSGWLILVGEQPQGFALLNVVAQGTVRTGKLVECLVQGDDSALQHAATTALTEELRRQGADLAIGFASTPWTTEALRLSGFTPAHRLEFTLRDRERLIPPGIPIHLSPFEADYAYSS